MGCLADLKTVYQLATTPVRGHSHAARLENFYGAQAENYDRFRDRLLHGRRELFEAIHAPDNGVWVDLGGGTGRNIEYLAHHLFRLRKAYVVDLAPSLLAVAKQRIKQNGWTNVEAVEADATTFIPPERSVDVVTFSYSLTMIPDWLAALDHACSLIRPGGCIGVVDFYVSRKYPDSGLARHSWWSRTFWPVWFAADNVFLSADHVYFLRHQFDVRYFDERQAPIPYLPLPRVPYYLFRGVRRANAST